MARITIIAGLLLVLVGLGFFIGTGMEHRTALIPVAFGAALIGLGRLARSEERRKMAMHLAVVIALLGFGGTARALGKVVQYLSGQPVDRPAAVIAQAIMAIVLGVFVALSIRSFMQARRNRAS
ncbi:MAG: hypothetical protein ACKV22_32720 [Bryobacteraceae bacterium]